MPKGTPRLARTTLDAVRSTSANTDEITGVTEWSGYLSLGGVDSTYMHDEEYGLGSAFVLLRTERIGMTPVENATGKPKRTGPKGAKVWICLANAETCYEEFRQCLRESE